MPAALYVRAVTEDARGPLTRLARSRTAAPRTVERAQIIWAASRGESVATIAQRLAMCGHTVRTWIKRCNTAGLAGLDDGPRSGRPTTYTADEVAEVIVLALTDPQTLALPLACWTLDRLAVSRHEVKGIRIKRARIAELLVAAGLRWRTQETWCGARVDPAFAETRGAARTSTQRRPRRVESCAVMRWAQKRPRVSRGPSACRRWSPALRRPRSRWQDERGKQPTMAGAVKAMSLGRCVRPQATS
jgi:transposase